DVILFFFFSSRRRHTRSTRDWSSDVCSSDLAWLLTIVRNTSYTLLKKNRVADLTTTFDEEIHTAGHESVSPATILEHSENAELKIGRASCREREEITATAETVTEKKTNDRRN